MKNLLKVSALFIVLMAFSFSESMSLDTSSSGEKNLELVLNEGYLADPIQQISTLDVVNNEANDRLSVENDLVLGILNIDAIYKNRIILIENITHMGKPIGHLLRISNNSIESDLNKPSLLFESNCATCLVKEIIIPLQRNYYSLGTNLSSHISFSYDYLLKENEQPALFNVINQNLDHAGLFLQSENKSVSKSGHFFNSYIRISQLA